MRLIQLLSFLAWTTQLTTAHPLNLQNKAQNVSPDDVSQAADNFAKDANTVSSAINSLPTMTDRQQIQDTARRAFNAESDEDNQRSVLIAAAGNAGSRSNRLIQQFTPAVLKGLDAIARAGTVESIQQNIPPVERARNPNILPSITQLSNAALDAVGSKKQAQNFPATTGISRLAQAGGNRGGNGGDDNNQNNQNDRNKNQNNQNDRQRDNQNNRQNGDRN